MRLWRSNHSFSARKKLTCLLIKTETSGISPPSGRSPSPWAPSWPRSPGTEPRPSEPPQGRQHGCQRGVGGTRCGVRAWKCQASSCGRPGQRSRGSSGERGRCPPRDPSAHRCSRWAGGRGAGNARGPRCATPAAAPGWGEPASEGPHGRCGPGARSASGAWWAGGSLILPQLPTTHVVAVDVEDGVPGGLDVVELKKVSDPAQDATHLALRVVLKGGVV